MKALYILYQIFIALPILLVLTILTALVTIRRPACLGILPRKNLVTTILLCIADSRKSSRASRSTGQNFICLCCQPSGLIRYIPHLRLFGPQFQMDDEEEPAENAFCW